MTHEQGSRFEVASLEELGLKVTVNGGDEPMQATAVGEADADNCHLIGEALLAPDLQGEVLHLNLSGLMFLDSSAIGELLRVHKVLGERGIELRIREPSHPVHRVLEITGLLEVFGLAALDPHDPET